MKNREYLKMLLSTNKKEMDLVSHLHTVHPFLLSIDYIERLNAYLKWKHQEVDRVIQEVENSLRNVKHCTCL